MNIDLKEIMTKTNKECVCFCIEGPGGEGGGGANEVMMITTRLRIMMLRTRMMILGTGIMTRIIIISSWITIEGKNKKKRR
jgi:hypothetical protein